MRQELDLAGKSRDDLLDMKLRTEEELDEMRALALSGTGSIAALEDQLRSGGRRVQAIQVALSKLRVQAQAERERRFERAFVEIVRSRLTTDDFLATCAQAWDACEPAEDGPVPVVVSLHELRNLLDLAWDTALTLEPEDEDPNGAAVEARLMQCVKEIRVKLNDGVKEIR